LLEAHRSKGQAYLKTNSTGTSSPGGARLLLQLKRVTLY